MHIHTQREELADARRKASALSEHNTKLQAEVEALRAALNAQPYVLPSPSKDQHGARQSAKCYSVVRSCVRVYVCMYMCLYILV